MKKENKTYFCVRELNGFTLIELLAVIVILAILALIVSPIISGVISNTKKASAQRSIEGYIKAIELAEVKYQYKNGGTITRDISKLSIETNGNNKVNITDIVINKKGIVESGEFEVDGNYYKYEDNKVIYIKYSEIKTSYNVSNLNYFFDVSYGLLRESIQNLTFTNVKPSGTGHDVSVNGDESILLYYSLNGNKVKNSSNVDIDAYDVTIYSKDIILAPANSSYYFYYLRNVINLKFNDKFDTSKVTDMSFMFCNTGYNAMTELNLGDKFDTSKVTNMFGMFSSTGRNAMTTLDLGDKFNTSSVTNMSYMFAETGRNAMTTLNLGDKFDTSSVTNMSYMFDLTGFSAMTTLDFGPLFKRISTTNTNMFTNTGKAGCIIKVHEDIYNGLNEFKLSKDNATTISYSIGTIEKEYLNPTTE